MAFTLEIRHLRIRDPTEAHPISCKVRFTHDAPQQALLTAGVPDLMSELNATYSATEPKGHLTGVNGASTLLLLLHTRTTQQ